MEITPINNLPHEETPAFHIKSLTKPDGRKLLLYSRRPLEGDFDVSKTLSRSNQNFAHFRWHPLRGEWVTYASHRQSRTFLPPKEYNPLAPMKNPEIPTELPQGDYEVAVFDNMFPSLDLKAEGAPDFYTPTGPATGSCEVVVFTQESDTSLTELPLERIELILKVIGSRYHELAKNPAIHYILPFENRGVEVGVTLHHPHGQIYAYPFFPPFIQKMATQQNEYFQKHKRPLISAMVENELKDQTRIIHDEKTVTSFIPVCARYPYEVWIAPKRSVPSLYEMTDEEIRDLSKTLKAVLMKYDGLWNKKFPYLMAMFNAPTRAQFNPDWHFHIEFFPPYRTSERLKYLAGTELGAGMFVNDSIPEEKAKELRDVKVNIHG